MALFETLRILFENYDQLCQTIGLRVLKCETCFF